MKNWKAKICLVSLVWLVLLVGCARLEPGTNSLIVRAEQTQAVGLATFDLVLGIDNASRDFYRTNAPAFHSFCEWLRKPVQIEDGKTLPASLALLHNLDQVKLAYSKSQVSSNVLASTLATLSVTLDQANHWILTIKKP